jgi:hypothetical protein
MLQRSPPPQGSGRLRTAARASESRPELFIHARSLVLEAAGAETGRRANRSWKAARIQRSVTRDGADAPATRGPTARSPEPTSDPSSHETPEVTVIAGRDWTE